MVNVKRLARHRIKQSRSASFVVCLICRLVLILCGVLPYAIIELSGDRLPLWATAVLLAACFVFCLLLCSGFRMGRELYFYSLAMNGNGRIKNLFSYFRPKRLIFAMRCRCIYYAVRIVRFILLMLPYMLSTYAFVMLLMKRSIPVLSAVLLAAGCSVLLAAGLWFFAVLNSGDALFFRFVTENDGLSPVEAMKKSRKQMKSRLYGAACLRIGFFPMLIFGIFIIPGSLVYGYFKESCCFYALEISCER